MRHDDDPSKVDPVGLMRAHRRLEKAHHHLKGRYEHLRRLWELVEDGDITARVIRNTNVTEIISAIQRARKRQQRIANYTSAPTRRERAISRIGGLNYTLGLIAGLERGDVPLAEEDHREPYDRKDEAIKRYRALEDAAAELIDALLDAIPMNDLRDPEREEVIAGMEAYNDALSDILEARAEGGL